MILTAQQIEEAVERESIKIEPFESSQVQAATYDLRVGRQGATTSGKKLRNLEEDGYLLIKPGDFAVVTVLEILKLGPQHAGRFGLRSKYARKGLVATTGPQIDPGYRGRLIVGLTNLTPVDVALPYKDHLVSVEFHELDRPTSRPYAGRYQDRMELGPEEIEMITEGSGMALSEVLTTLSSLSSNVSLLSDEFGSLSQQFSALTSEMKFQRWIVPLIVGAGIAIIAILVSMD